MVSTKSRMPSCGGLYAWLLFDFCPTEYLAHIHMNHGIHYRWGHGHNTLEQEGTNNDVGNGRLVN